jgi:CHAT domain-containing protein
LLAPFRTRLEKVNHVVVVPFGHLHRLPFLAIPWGSGVLGETHSISYLPSGSVMQYLQSTEPAGTAPILSIGNPANMAWPSVEGGNARAAPSLPFAALEARYVASLRAGSRHLVDEHATMIEVRPAIPNYRLLHFATHGVLNERVPLSSAILLANGEALTPADFLGTGLSADLVVLSGCRTGLGDVTAGDEVVGLTRTLLASGAKAAVVSLWPVRDAATSYFMRHFYEQLTKIGPARALQQAQAFLRKLTPEQYDHERQRLVDAVREPESASDGDGRDISRDIPAPEVPTRPVDYSHPYFWAPFIYVGAHLH